MAGAVRVGSFLTIQFGTLVFLVRVMAQGRAVSQRELWTGQRGSFSVRAAVGSPVTTLERGGLSLHGLVCAVCPSLL